MLSKIEKIKQKKLEAILQAQINAQKVAKIQAKTGRITLASSFCNIMRQLVESKSRYRYILNLSNLG